MQVTAIGLHLITYDCMQVTAIGSDLIASDYL
jgi:hypothetical protein